MHIEKLLVNEFLSKLILTEIITILHIAEVAFHFFFPSKDKFSNFFMYEVSEK